MSELHVWRHCGGGHLWGLVGFAVTFVFYDYLVCLSEFIVEDFQINGVSTFIEAHHDAIVGGKAISVVSGMEWFH